MKSPDIIIFKRRRNKVFVSFGSKRRRNIEYEIVQEHNIVRKSGLIDLKEVILVKVPKEPTTKKGYPPTSPYGLYIEKLKNK